MIPLESKARLQSKHDKLKEYFLELLDEGCKLATKVEVLEDLEQSTYDPQELEAVRVELEKLRPEYDRINRVLCAATARTHTLERLINEHSSRLRK